MSVQRMDHVGIVIEDLAAATEFFLAIGLTKAGEGEVGGDWVDRIIGLEGARSQVVSLKAPESDTWLELTKFLAPPGPAGDSHAPANAPGLRHLAFEVTDLDTVVADLRARGVELVGSVEQYEQEYRLCYVHGPEGIIVELAERIG